MNCSDIAWVIKPIEHHIPISTPPKNALKLKLFLIRSGINTIVANKNLIVVKMEGDKDFCNNTDTT